ncbi:MAG: (Fe-S)-binding protein [Planctomycetaceae bacterium]|jgi:L-lactate dehydrogenase complex protein LldE
MKVALFIPCYVDQFYPDVGLATVQVLESLGVQVDFPEQQTCCGQPMANSGCMPEARPLAEKFIDTFAGYDYIVSPSGSCVSMVRNHYDHLVSASDQQATLVRRQTLELGEFLVQVLGIRSLSGVFPHQVGLHQSCHGLRELRLGPCSESMTARESLLQLLLGSFTGISFSQLQRKDECCGFGGTFAVGEEAVSAMMGEDRINDHLQAGTEVLTAGDMSCLMHLDGIIRRRALPIRVLHYAQIMAQAMQQAPDARQKRTASTGQH